MALSLLTEVGARMLVTNELAGRRDVRRESLNLLRFLVNELRIPGGRSWQPGGLPGGPLRSDDQLENRFDPFVLPVWEEGEQARSLLARFAASFPLHKRSVIDTDDMAQYLLARRSEGTIGELAHLLTTAAVAAVLES